ncbi:MAG: hypothetical protein AABZ77_04375, partial [Chloroflexota bacterium]
MRHMRVIHDIGLVCVLGFFLSRLCSTSMYLSIPCRVSNQNLPVFVTTVTRIVVASLTSGKIRQAGNRSRSV